MGFGPFSSESNADLKLTTVQDQGQLISGKGAKTAQGEGVLLDATKGGAATTNGIAIGQKGNLNTGLQFGNLKNASVVINDMAPVNELSKSFTDTLKELNDSTNSALSGALNRQLEASDAAGERTSGLLGDILSKVGDLAENKQTDGESGRNQTMLWVVAGVLLLMGVLFYHKR